MIGFYAICTDLSDNVTKIIELNHNRWESEDAFRVIKTDFKGRPVFVWTAEHIAYTSLSALSHYCSSE